MSSSYLQAARRLPALSVLCRAHQSGRVLLLAPLLLAGNAVAQSYNPAGVQTNVPVANVTAGGWSVCHSSTYADSSSSIAAIQAACSGQQVMLACRPTGNPNYTVLAQAPRSDVFFDTGTGNTPHNANGVGWYFNNNYSMGFAPAGAPISRSSCDTANTGDPMRMCVHTGGGNLNTGWRCGATTGLNFNNGWERVILHANAVPVVVQGTVLTVAGSSQPVSLAEELILPPSRTFANPAGELNLSSVMGYAFSVGEVRHARLECPGAVFTTATIAGFSGDASNTLGALNGIGTDTLTFSVTAGANPVQASDVFTVDGTRNVASTAAVNCSYSLYDFPSQAQAGGSVGRVATTSGAYLHFDPSYALIVDAQGKAVANVESADPAYSQFVPEAPAVGLTQAQLGGFSYGTSAQVNGVDQPLTTTALPVTLGDLMATSTALVFSGDFSVAADVFLSTSSSCGFQSQAADAFDDQQAVFTVGSGSRMNHFLCFVADGHAIPVSDYSVALAPVSATPALYAVTARGPLDLGQIQRNGTRLQAPLAQVPGGWLSRMALTNTGSLARAYTIKVIGETGNTLGTANLSGTVPANGTIVVDLNSVLTSFAGGAPRATLVVNVAGPNNQIQGLYQIVNPDSGSISNHVMVRPGTN